MMTTSMNNTTFLKDLGIRGEIIKPNRTSNNNSNHIDLSQLITKGKRKPKKVPSEIVINIFSSFIFIESAKSSLGNPKSKQV